MYEVNVNIWPGSSSFVSGSTPFGFYDSDPTFINDIDKVAVWCSRRLGYPITDIELQDVNFYAAFEESIIEYSSQVNSLNARDNLLPMVGLPSTTNLSGQLIKPSLQGVFRVAKQYGSEVGAGGYLTYYTGSISLSKDKQVYDLLSENVELEKGDFNTDIFTIRRILYEYSPAINRSIDPGISSGFVDQQMLTQFGWSGFSSGMNYTTMPLYHDLLKLQAVEFYDQIKKSGYSFQLTNNRLRIFPIPTSDYKIFFLYTLNDEILENISTGSGNYDTTGSGVITDYSNIPYNNIPYTLINDIGKTWIRKYTLALSKEMLGLVRGKYSAIPIPENEITLNGAELVSSAQTEKEALIQELKDTLESMGRQAQLERKTAEADALTSQINKVPMKIYIR